MDYGRARGSLYDLQHPSFSSHSFCNLKGDPAKFVQLIELSQLTCTTTSATQIQTGSGGLDKGREGNAWNPHKPGMSHLVSCPKYLLSTSQMPSSVHVLRMEQENRQSLPLYGLKSTGNLVLGGHYKRDELLRKGEE